MLYIKAISPQIQLQKKQASRDSTR